MKRHGLFGEKLSHSISPEIQEYIYSKIGYDAKYSLIEFEQEDMHSEIERLSLHQLDGVNVTIPYKEKIIKYLDGIDEKAGQIGAVNTIDVCDKRLIGYNTDYYGIEMTLKAYEKLEGKDYIILGYGGAARPMIHCLVDKGANNIYIATRRKERIKDYTLKNTEVRFIGYEDIENIDCKLMINTTPLGMYPHIEDSPIKDIEKVSAEGIIDFVYNPSETLLLREAKKKNITVQNGLKILVYQAIKSVEIWSKKNIDEKTQMDIYLHFRKKYKGDDSIYLLGIPGSGKSTVAKELADRLGYDYIDVDEYIEEKHSMSIGDIFVKYGEVVFRDMESNALKEISLMPRRVVATGGGAILRQENRDLIKEATTIFIDRDLEDILRDVDMQNRPLLKDYPQKIYELQKERMEYYISSAKYRVKNDGSIENLVEKILHCL